MRNEELIARNIEMGAKYPYDGDDDGALAETGDWATAAARGILYDLNDRRGIKQELRNIDYDVRCELVATMAAIIRAAVPTVSQ